MTKGATKGANIKSRHPSQPPTTFMSFFSKRAKHLAVAARKGANFVFLSWEPRRGSRRPPAFHPYAPAPASARNRRVRNA